jgi:clan AA aspartic protease (TIGR02281 family)
VPKPLRYWILIASLLFCAPPGLAEPGASPGHSFHPSTELLLYAHPDESSAVVASVKRGETFSALAETVGGAGAKWYLIKTSAGAVGWIKKTDSEQSKKLEEFFKSRSVELPAKPSQELSPTYSPAEPTGTIRVPVQITGASVVVPVTLNRRLKTSLALDTGATSTMISHRVANNLGLRTDGPRIVAMTANGQVSLPLARLGSVKVGDAEIHNVTVTVHDLPSAAKVDGLLGLDFLKRFHVSLDSRNQVLLLAPR